MLTALTNGLVLLLQAGSVAGLVYGGLLCLNADSMFQVARKARDLARARASQANMPFPIGAHS